MFASNKMSRLRKLVKSRSALALMSRKPEDTIGQTFLDDEAQEPHQMPYIPPEIWILIIREATALIPDPLDTTQAVSFIDPPNSTLRHSQYCQSMQRKQTLACVSRFWNCAIQEFLYEFIWIKNAAQAKRLALALSLQAQQSEDGSQAGRYIRRLHIQTPVLQKCDPIDLRTIIDFAPNLIVYSDHRSIRRNLAVEKCNPGSSPEALFKALAHPTNSLKRLSWTNYDDFSFHLNLSPMLEATAANLEFLELNFSSVHLHSMNPNSSSHLHPSIDLQLPSLRSLKVTLDNATFSVLSGWCLPRLRNLSVVSADFSYAGPGFSQFFKIHGVKLRQLELGHSSSLIEEHYLTSSNGHPPVTSSMMQQRIPLATWCPNLREFICSADAEWNWENPDWIAPHVLLPAHPFVEFIGIRDIDKRLKDDLEFARGLGHGTNHAQAGEDDDLSAFFSIMEQINSLLHAQSFPSLKFVRDLSEGSDQMRKGLVSIGPYSSVIPTSTELVTHNESSSAGNPLNPTLSHSHQLQSSTNTDYARVLRFWNKVLEQCKARGVWLEDCRGFNLTRRDLRAR